ncbi:LPS assembly lipoprotein LptE [Devosia sp.]|uniref:LPS assembly lipoprotein LptE n=1 Tax=Devosia sp. TaxID=1871048 RepID=UPI001AC544E0|nr:LPS assembly lipoprotein LptE [Devosia sp.]MBN9334374.1 hypothetical protein [Devosia sp.]
MLSSRLKRLALIVPLALVSAGLGACSFQPVYSGRLAENPQLQLAYAEPTTRLEQIVYQELSFRLGKTTSPTAPLITAKVSTSAAEPYLSATANPNKPREMTVTATLTITPRDGVDTKPITITRTAKAQHTRSGQVLADEAAMIEAQERAARSVAESLRLAVLAALAKG